jgi:hypothetical protein
MIRRWTTALAEAAALGSLILRPGKKIRHCGYRAGGRADITLNALVEGYLNWEIDAGSSAYVGKVSLFFNH